MRVFKRQDHSWRREPILLSLVVPSHAFYYDSGYSCTFSWSTGVALNSTQSLNLCIISRVLWMAWHLFLQWNRGPVLSSTSPTSTHLPSPKLLLEHCQIGLYHLNGLKMRFRALLVDCRSSRSLSFSPELCLRAPCSVQDLLADCHCGRRAWPTSPCFPVLGPSFTC